MPALVSCGRVMLHGHERVMSVMQWNPAIWISDGRQFATEVRTEFKKITWPSQKEAIGGTIGVVVIVIVITVALSLVDAVLGKVVQFVFG
jgi:preprotein translocase subunit SecE